MGVGVSVGRVPVVSVVVPGRDVSGFIGDALCSLSRQFEDPDLIEVVFVDDGSTDGSAACAEETGGALRNLVILQNAESVGVSKARNQGIDVARGRYLAFLDADDWFAPLHLAKMARDIESIGCEFLRTDTVLVRGFERELRRAPQGCRGVSLDPRKGILPVEARTMVDHPWSQVGLFDRLLADRGLLRFEDRLHTTEDRVLIWGLHLKASTYAVVDSPGFFYRRGVATSLTQALDERRLDYLKAMESIRLLVEADREAERFMPKAVQTMLALTAVHVAVWDQMSAELRSKLFAGVQETLSTYPAEVVADRIENMPPARAEVLMPVLGNMPMKAGKHSD
jgi:glycosyltransferase involved in cell wall biosynthesis